MRSDDIFPNRLTRVDDLTRPDHSYLTEEDVCFFLGEYTARQGFAYSATNNLMINFKKPVDRRCRAEWQYKERAIETAATTLRQALNRGALDRLTFVPTPPSKAKDHPLYDNRLTRMLCAVRRDPPLDVRELIVQTESTDAVHDSDIRPRPEEIKALYEVDETMTEPRPREIVVVDDLLTTGAHFRAMESILSVRFPEATVVGLFIARRAPNTADLND